MITSTNILDQPVFILLEKRLQIRKPCFVILRYGSLFALQGIVHGCLHTVDVANLFLGWLCGERNGHQRQRGKHKQELHSGWNGFALEDFFAQTAVNARVVLRFYKSERFEVDRWFANFVASLLN